MFFSFRIMAGLGMLMILTGLLGLLLRRNGGLYRNRLFLRLVLWMGPSGLIALLAGWITTEVGRQPGWCTACCAPATPPPTTAWRN